MNVIINHYRQKGTFLVPVVLCLFFGSGFIGLVYQVVWIKTLTQVFGVTTYAISVVLGAFMGGLAFGSYLGGKWSDRQQHRLRLYGGMEIFIGMYALFLPLFLDGLVPLYRILYPSLENLPYLLTFVRFILSFLILAIPTTLMGATLPLLVRTLVDRYETLGNKVARLYAWNTLGAVIGTLVTSFFLIGLVGLTVTTMIAAALNLIIGLVALILSVGPVAQPDSPPPTAARPGLSEMAGARRKLAILGLMFLSGFAALGFEVIWTRILTVVSDHTVYAFGSMLAIVLMGISLGSYGFARIIPRLANPLQALVLVEIALGVSAAFLILVITWGVQAEGLTTNSNVLGQFMRTPFFLFFFTLTLTLLPSLCMGATFPLAVQAYGCEQDTIGQNVGGVYSANVLGAMLGSLAAGFVLIPWWGSQRSLLGLALITLLAAGWLAWAGGQRNEIRLSSGLAVILTIILLFTPGNLYRSLFVSMYPALQMVETFEGVEAIVTVAEYKEVQFIYMNGRHEANSSALMLAVHRWLGHLPAMVHPALRRALVIGVGGGATSGALVQHVQEQLDIIELSEEMVSAARLFAPYNKAVLDDSRVHLRFEDGRNYLLLTDQKYDVIVADTIHALRAYSSNVYSVEYFQLLAAHLNQNGLMLQWVDDSLTEDEQRIIIRTFIQAFPHVQAWCIGDLNLLLGSPDPIELDPTIITAGFTPQIAYELVPLGLTGPEKVVAGFGLADDPLRRNIGPGLIVSDDHPYNEHFHLLRRETVRNWVGD